MMQTIYETIRIFVVKKYAIKFMKTFNLLQKEPEVNLGSSTKQQI